MNPSKNVFIYTPGRVGSNYIRGSLANDNLSVISAHSLSSGEALDKIKRNEGSKRIIEDVKDTLKAWQENSEHIYILTAVRNPLIRNLSAFCFFYKNWDFKTRTPVHIIKERFIKEFPHEWYLDWFDVHVKDNFNIDVYNYDFLAGENIIERNNITLGILRTERLDEDLSSVLPKLNIQKKNCIFRHKQKSKIEHRYKKLKQERYPIELMNKLFSSKFAKHFLNLQEIEDSINRWSNR